MKITTLQIRNSFLGWDFKEIQFLNNLTLLVGVSGVGKTQILRSINDLQDISKGKSINGFEWKITFDTILGKNFIWEGAFEVIQSKDKSFEFDGVDENKAEPIVLFEKLTFGDEIIINRDKDEIRFKGSIMPKLSSTQSMIYTLKEEDSIKDVHDAFQKILFKDHTKKEGGHISLLRTSSISELKKRYETLEDIKNSNEPIRIKLFLSSEKKLNVFKLVKNRFLDVFPQVQDIKIEQIEGTDFPLILIDKTTPIISIKEKGVSKWIREDRMSSGMLRTIVHISELFLSNDGSVILIDEFENSLGVNCIDILTDDLIHENKNLQFIATSHHPYIINNIPYEYWKIVKREGGHIQVRDAYDYNLGKSKQDAFIQLTKILEK